MANKPLTTYSKEEGSRRRQNFENTIIRLQASNRVGNFISVVDCTEIEFRCGAKQFSE